MEHTGSEASRYTTPATGSNDSRTGRLRHPKQTGGSGLSTTPSVPVVLVCVGVLTLKPTRLSILIAEAFGLPTTEGTRGSGAATTRGTLDLGFNFVPLSTPCLRTVPFAFLDGRRSMSPTSRPAARNLCFALVRLSPLTAGTRASFGVGVDGVDVGGTEGLLAGAGTAVGVGSRSDPEATSPTMRSSPRTPLPIARAIVRGLRRTLRLAAFRRWCVHACPSQSRSRPGSSGSGYQPGKCGVLRGQASSAGSVG